MPELADMLQVWRTQTVHAGGAALRAGLRSEESRPPRRDRCRDHQDDWLAHVYQQADQRAKHGALGRFSGVLTFPVKKAA